METQGDDGPNHHPVVADVVAAEAPAADSERHVANKRRKFTIQSNFGQARERRSRKNRPCDACRKRKTACVIEANPPCNFCKSRGMECISSGIIGGGGNSTSEGNSPQDTSPRPSITSSPAIPSRRQDAVMSPVSLPTTAPTPSHNSPHPSMSQPSPASVPASTPGKSGKPATPGTVTTYTKGKIEGMGVWPTNGPGRIHTLEDNINKTANYMGPTAEQDTYILDSFRYMIVSEIDEIDADYLQVYSGNTKPNDAPVHFLLLENEVPEYTERPKLEASDAIESRVFPYSPNLVRLFFKYIHPVYPVVSKVRFLRQYATAKEKIPASLRGAVYALATVFWNRDPSLKGPCPWEQHELHTRAQASLRCELENPNLANLQACLLLLHMAPPWTDTVETPSIWILAAQAVSCAQMSGLHQDPTDWNIEPWEKKLRKKLWWAVYAADCWTSVCHGNPPHIYPASFDTTVPNLDDIRFDEDVPEDLRHLIEPDASVFQIAVGARFLEMVRITRVVRDLIDCSFLVNPRARCAHNVTQSTATLEELREKLRDWPSMLPQCLSTKRENSMPAVHNNGPLHLMYYAAKALLFRALMSPASKTARADPNSSLRKWFPIVVHEMEQFTAFMNDVTEGDLQGFWGRLGRSQLILCGNFLIQLFIIAADSHDIKLAHHVLLSFHQSLQRLAATEYYVGKLLLRPVVLRIDSFFSQAEEIIRRGGHGYWQLDALNVIRDNGP